MIELQFVPWYTSADIARLAPDDPGVFQVRQEQLIEYPSGRSAMIHYGAADNLRAELLRWVSALMAEDSGRILALRFRHCDELGHMSPQDALAKLLGRFESRFGAEPGA